MRRLSRMAILLLLVAGGLAAQELGVSYVEGQVHLQKGAAWKGVAIGDSLPPDAVLRLGESSFAELKGGGVTISLSRPGTYVVSRVLEAARTMSSSGVRTSLLAKLMSFAQVPLKNTGIAAGTRGADQASGDPYFWSESGIQMYMDAGKEFLRSDAIDKAIDQFMQALDEAGDDEAPEVHYYLAYAYSLDDDIHAALKHLASVVPSATEEWTPDFIILKGKLLVDTFAYGEAVQWLTENGKDLSADAERAQMYFMLLALGYRGIGNQANEKLLLQKVMGAAPDSDLGKAAAELSRAL